MVVMRCISVQQIVRSDIQAGRKILQQLNRAAAASRFNFCKMVRSNVQHYTQLLLCNPLLFPQIADTSAEFFCIKSHCSILSFAPETQTGRDSFSESRLVFRTTFQQEITADPHCVRQASQVVYSQIALSFSNAQGCCTEISASAASRSCVQPFSRRLPRILLPTCTLS